jgi:hypothetical protein
MARTRVTKTAVSRVICAAPMTQGVQALLQDAVLLAGIAARATGLAANPPERERAAPEGCSLRIPGSCKHRSGMKPPLRPRLAIVVAESPPIHD